MFVETNNNTNLFLLHLLLHQNGLLLVLAPLVLEPYPDDPGRQTRHLHQLFLHKGVGSGVGGVARAQRVQLLLVEDGADARRLAVAARAAPATHAASGGGFAQGAAAFVRAALRAGIWKRERAFLDRSIGPNRNRVDKKWI